MNRAGSFLEPSRAESPPITEFQHLGEGLRPGAAAPPSSPPTSGPRGNVPLKLPLSLSGDKALSLWGPPLPTQSALVCYRGFFRKLFLCVELKMVVSATSFLIYFSALPSTFTCSLLLILTKIKSILSQQSF